MRRSSLATALLWLVQTDASCLTSVACNGAGQTWQLAGITYSCCSNTAANSGKFCSSASDCTAATASPTTPSPPPPLPPASQASAYFTVVGPCPTDGACVRSPHYPSDYGNSQPCTITLTRLAVGQLLSATAGFNTESGCDKLTVNGVAYSGTTGPSGVVLASAFTWLSSVSTTDTGWKVCTAPLRNLVLAEDGETCAAGTEITSLAVCSAAIAAANAAIGKQPGEL